MDGTAQGVYEPARTPRGRAAGTPLLDKFALNPAFAATSEPLADLKLCHARLQRDSRWPWIVLIPRKVGAREIEHLSPPNRQVLMDEIVLAGAAVRAVAAALGRPVVAIFGPTDERATGPIGVHEVLTAPVFCRPCLLRDCPIDHRCMKRITVDQVFTAAVRVVGGARANGAS